ncbi:MAG: nucleotidyltransferase family protein [Nevskiaceae bacterium]|nr:MAG: nucleotidyltransferase family protein [Nevskiaceae bacterium]TBR72544.1 MAG: nucleotidyltransferase family protein [Nevskiaceae bacterium]
MASAVVRNPAIGAIVMAAGAGRRMGNVPKCLFQRDGEALLLRQLRLVTAAGVAPAVVVLGHYAECIERTLAAARMRRAPGLDTVLQVVNPAPDRGPGSSLRCGLAALPAALDAVLVVLGDQPLLEERDVTAVLAAWAARAPGIALLQPRHGDSLGHPVLFDANVRAEVAAAQDGEGLRTWRRTHPDRAQIVALDHDRCTTDIDTPDDLRRLHAIHGVQLVGPATA